MKAASPPCTDHNPPLNSNSRAAVAVCSGDYVVVSPCQPDPDVEPRLIDRPAAPTVVLDITSVWRSPVPRACVAPPRLVLTADAGDENLPKCRKCERAGRRCVREPPRRFRHFNAPSQSGQKQIWLPVPPKGQCPRPPGRVVPLLTLTVDFVDETSNVVDGAEDAESSADEESAPQPERSPAVAPQASEEVPGANLPDVNPSPSAGAQVFAEKYPSPTALSPFSRHQNRAPSLTSSPTYAALRELSRPQTYVVPDAPVSIAQSPGQLSQTWLPNQWPLQSEEEAMLLRFFLDHISTFVSQTGALRGRSN